MSYNPIILKKLITKEHIFMLLESLGAHGISNDQNGVRSSCPIHHSSGTSTFTYNMDKNVYICYGECDDDKKEGDLINLVEHAQKLSYSNAVEYICEACEIDINLLENNGEFLLEELKLKIDFILTEISDRESIEEDDSLYYGVNPIDEGVLLKFLNLKDELGFIDSQGFKDSTLELFESGYNKSEQRWLLPQRTPEGELIGFDGRDITNRKKDKWRKRAGLLKNKLLGRLDLISHSIIENNKIILCEGIKDQMNLYEAGFPFSSCIYGSTFAIEQKQLVDSLIDNEIIIAPDADKAGYKMVNSVVKLAYPEYLITVMETPDGEDPGALSKKEINRLYENRISVEEWLKRYEYLSKGK